MSKTHAHVGRIRRRPHDVSDRAPRQESPRDAHLEPTCDDRQEPICDCCHEPILDRGSLRLLRSKNTVPEDFTVLRLHKKCVGEFLVLHPGGWDEYALDAPEAKWLLPLSE